MLWWSNFVLGWLVFAVWTVALLPSVAALWFRRLPKTAGRIAAPPAWPSLSIIVPARDEERNIEAALGSMLACDYPDLEVIAVDDRSRDETGAVMDRLASEDARLRVIHIADLPEGWLGKTHALHAGARAARGELLLFTDGDVLFAPDALRLAVAHLLHCGTDHLCLIPRMVPGTYWENALVTFFGVIFVVGTQPWLVPTPFRWAYVGVGAFNLVRREAYDRSGGFEAIRLDVLDDVKLGKLLKQSGFRQEVLLAGDRVEVRWQQSAWGAIRGLEKNGFAALEYSLARTLAATVVFVLLCVVPYAAVAARPGLESAGWAAALVLVHLVYAALGRIWGGGWRLLPAFPLAGLAMAFAFWRSAVITHRQGGVRWRDTFYPLDVLRANVYR